jgi:CRP/FNR family transcriptional regulator
MNLVFRNIFEPELQSQIDQLALLEIDKGNIILKEDTYIKQIPLVISGNIKVRKLDETGKELVLYHIEPGESCVLSITSCLNNNQSKAEAITEADTKMIIIPAEKVKEWMEEYRTWRQFVMKLYDARLYELLTLIDGISFKQTDIRLCNKLKSLQKRHGNELHITHQTLANEIGTAREVISRLLKQLEKEEYITLDRGVIKILRPL